MPGITGFISLNHGMDMGGSLNLMVGSMLHEPFYRSGTVQISELGVEAGWVAHPNTCCDCQPVWNTRKDVGLIFAGEHFGKGLDSLLEEYDRTGPAVIAKLNGVFSGLLIDLRQRTITLFNDRFGLGRVYIHEHPDVLYFSSEAKALLRVLPECRKIDQASLGEMLACGCALQNRTLFPNISLLPPGSSWTISRARNVRVQKSAYFKPENWTQTTSLSAPDYDGELNRVFTRILPRYFQATLPVGLSLTGGLDSRMIAAGAATQNCNYRSHTFGGPYRECADVRLAKRIAGVTGDLHEVIAITPEFHQQFGELASKSVYISDGAMDVTGSVELFVNRAVRARTPVRVTGNYGSEILRENVTLKLGRPDASLFDPAVIESVSAARATYLQERAEPALPFIAFKQVPWFHYARYSVEQSQVTVRSPFLDNELVALAHRAPSDAAAKRSVAHHYIADHNPELAAIPTDRGAVGREGAAGSRMRHFFREFIPRVEYLCDYGMPNWLARVNRMLGPLGFDRLFLGRQKFYHFRRWYSRELSDYVQGTLLSENALSRPYLQRRRVEKMVRAHVSGRENHTLSIHRLLTLELVHLRLFGT